METHCFFCGRDRIFKHYLDELRASNGQDASIILKLSFSKCDIMHVPVETVEVASLSVVVYSSLHPSMWRRRAVVALPGL
jgi:hypothetical protein